MKLTHVKDVCRLEHRTGTVEIIMCMLAPTCFARLFILISVAMHANACLASGVHYSTWKHVRAYINPTKLPSSSHHRHGKQCHRKGYELSGLKKNNSIITRQNEYQLKRTHTAHIAADLYSADYQHSQCARESHTRKRETLL